MNSSFQVDMRSLAQILESRGLETNGRVQRYIDSEVLRRCAPYAPFQQGALEQSGQSGTDIGSGEVVYNAPYARYLYYGKVMAGRAPKAVTDKDIRYSGAPKRGAFWFERMKADHLGDILKGAKREAGAD